MRGQTRRVVVVGSGAGGLTAAAYLARDDFDVVVLEQADHPGGLIAPFERKGYRFDPGLHYVGQCRPGQLVHEVLRGLDIDAGRMFVELDPDGFDHYRFGTDFAMELPRGLELFRDRIRRAVPGDDYGLIEIFALARALYDLMGLSSKEHVRLRDVPFLEIGGLLRWSRSSFGELLHHFLDDARSRAVLAGAAGDYGLPPSRASAIGALSILAHYGDGAFYPRGGSGALRDALVAAATERGARVRTGCAVERIEVAHGRVAAVHLTNGEVLGADFVVSDADPTITFGELVGLDALPERMRRRVPRVEPSLGACTVYLGLARDVKSRGLGAFNVWTYPSLDVEAAYAPLLAGELPDEPALLVSSGSAKDDTGASAPPGCSTVEIVTFVPHAAFAKWEGVAPSDRGPEYAAAKDRIEAWILATVERRMPGLVGDVVVCETSTPLSLARWTRAVHGGAYGPAMTPDQWGPFRFGTRTPIEGLLLAGAGVLGGGVAPALLSGKLAALAAARGAGHHLSDAGSVVV